MWDVVVGHFAEHVASDTIDNRFTGLTSSTAGIFRLYTDYSLQHCVRRVRLIPAPCTTDSKLVS